MERIFNENERIFNENEPNVNNNDVKCQRGNVTNGQHTHTDTRTHARNTVSTTWTPRLITGLAREAQAVGSGSPNRTPTQPNPGGLCGSSAAEEARDPDRVRIFADSGFGFRVSGFGLGHCRVVHYCSFRVRACCCSPSRVLCCTCTCFSFVVSCVVLFCSPAFKFAFPRLATTVVVSRTHYD